MLTLLVHYRNLLAAHPDKQIILKFSAPWCQACRTLAEKFRVHLLKQSIGNKQPRNVVYAVVSCGSRHLNSEAVQCATMGIFQLPTMQFYAPGSGLVESFPCGPNNLTWVELKQKMGDFIIDVEQEDDELVVLADSAAASQPTAGRFLRLAKRINPFKRRQAARP